MPVGFLSGDCWSAPAPSGVGKYIIVGSFMFGSCCLPGALFYPLEKGMPKSKLKYDPGQHMTNVWPNYFFSVI